MSDNLYDLVKENLLKKSLDGTLTLTNIACYGFIKRGTKLIHWNVNHACHAGMTESKGYDYCIDVIQNLSPKYSTDNEEYRLMFLDYVMNRSPFACTFITKDAALSIKDGFNIRDLHKPSNLVQCGLILTRALQHDFSMDHLIDSFGTLVEAGLQEDMALILGGYIKFGDTKARIFMHGSGHCWWNPDSGLGALKAFINHRPRNLTPSFFDGSGYMGSWSLFPSSEGSIYYWLSESCNTISSEEKESINPFESSVKKKTIVTNQYPKDKFLKHIVNFGNKFYQENKG